MGWDLEVLSESWGFITRAVINWVRQVGEQLPDVYAPETIPEVGELDEARNFCQIKKNAHLVVDGS